MSIFIEDGGTRTRGRRTQEQIYARERQRPQSAPARYLNVAAELEVGILHVLQVVLLIPACITAAILYTTYSIS